MKKPSISIVAFAGLFAIQSCTPGPPPSPYHITGTGGSISSFSSIGSSVTNGGAAGAKISVNGTTSTGAQIVMYINPYAGITGTFPMLTNTGCEYRPVAGGTVLRSVHGNITITSVSPDIIGSFVFTAQDSSVNTGTFHLPPPTM